jgi:tRNA dimethylallyltransferase
MNRRYTEEMATALKSHDAPVFLVGATATGKSDAALALAREWGGAILAMDAMQVYRGADIGTGKPSAAERAEVPHGGLDLAEVGEGFDVARYLEQAGTFLREQREVGRRVIVVGGTGLYFRALTRGLCEAPQGSDELRAELRALSVEELRVRLERVDPGMIERLDRSNPRRLARAIEVKEATGRSLLAWQEKTPEPLTPDFTAIWIGRAKEELQERIAVRVEAMFAAGWVEEVRRLAERHGWEAVAKFPGIGYREIGEALRVGGKGAVPESVKSDIIVATRQYAKRQLTWFAREPNLHRVMLSGNQPISAALLSLP